MSPGLPSVHVNRLAGQLGEVLPVGLIKNIEIEDALLFVECEPNECQLLTQRGHGLLFRGSASQDHRQSFRTAPKFEVGALYRLTIEVHVERLPRLDREG
jgi:hypothetical protein